MGRSSPFLISKTMFFRRSMECFLDGVQAVFRDSKPIRPLRPGQHCEFFHRHFPEKRAKGGLSAGELSVFDRDSLRSLTGVEKADDIRFSFLGNSIAGK